MNKMFLLFVALASLAFFSTSASADCMLTRESCTYECIETNQHGQCVKTKKICEQICVQFSVDVSGQDTKNYPPPEAQETPKETEPKK